jgi:hypothetical protein
LPFALTNWMYPVASPSFAGAMRGVRARRAAPEGRRPIAAIAVARSRSALSTWPCSCELTTW